MTLGTAPPAATDFAANPLLDIEDLTLRSGPVEVLRNLTLRLPRGRIVGLIGESGAGKTMVGRVIAGQVPAGFAVTGGRMLFGGGDLLTLDAAARRALMGRRIACVPQEPMSSLNPVLTIGRQFGEHLARLGVPRRHRHAAAVAALADMRLAEPEQVLDKHPFQLSGGMCQRVLLAFAFASEPDLVIADEPTASLDTMTQLHIVALLRALQRRHGTGVLFITHDLRLAGHLCDEIAVLYAGEIVEQGPARALLERPGHPYARALRAANPNILGRSRPLRSLAGNMPGLSDLAGLDGCRFAARCASAAALCRGAVPPLVARADGRAVRCVREDAEPRFEPERPSDTPPLPASLTPVIVAEGIAKTYRKGGWLVRSGETRVLHGVNLSVAPAEFVGIVGESGSGKSTFGRLLMGLEEPSAGRILLNGEPAGGSAAEWSRRTKDIQLVFQDPRSALNPRRRVMSLVTQPLEARSFLLRDRLSRMTDLLCETGLPPDVAHRYAHQLSGGQRQRVNIARALCAMPRLLIADEIVSGLDVSVQAQILNLLLALRREYGIALLMISHDLAVVRYLCSRVVVLCRGEVVETGPTDMVFSAPRHPYTRALIAAVPTEELDRPWPAPDV